MERVLSPLPDPVVRECLRVPVGTPTAERGLSPASSPGKRCNSSNGAAALPAMHTPFSPPMSRGQPRVPLSTMQRASGDFQTPAPQQSGATERVVAGAASRGTETMVGSREIQELAGGALRVVTSPIKGASRYRASYGDGKRKRSGGSGAMQLVPEASRLKDQSFPQAARPTSRIEDSRRRSGSEHVHHALRTSSASVSGGSLGPPLRELRRGSIAHCNGSSAGRRERGIGESRQRESTQETSRGGSGDTTGKGKRWSSECGGGIHERAARRVSTWSSSSGASSRRSSEEGSCDGAKDKSVSSAVRLSSVAGSSISDKMSRRESNGGREGRVGGLSSKRWRDEEEGEEHEKYDGQAKVSMGASASTDETGFHRGNKRSRESAIMGSSSRRSSIWGEGSAAVSGKGVAFADGAQVGDCDLGQRLSIDHFEMNKSLGMGKFGRVYRAKVKQSSKNKTVALKVLSKSSLNIASRQELINLRREVEIQTKLSHISIVRMVTWFQDSKWFYLVLDYAAGGDVYKALRRSSNGLPHDTAAKYLRDAVSAVAYLHENHVIHRDIKPENLLLDSRGRVKLSDFGWSVHAVPPRFHERQTLCGTPEYAAPEMLVKSPKYKYPVDIWSLGVLSYELLTGETPFVSSRSARTATADNSSISSVSALSSSPCGTDGVTTAAADIEAIHKGDPHASLYGRIATWRGSPDSLFGEGTLGEAIPDAAQDVVLAMLRPRPEDRRDTREVLRLPWLTLVDPADA